MSRSVVFRREARLEFDEAFVWYEGKQRGLGIEFQNVVDDRLSQAAERPELFRAIRGSVRRIVLSRFPYSVHFVAENSRIVVLAVFHAHRNPKHLAKRS